ncbi:MAG: Rpn family recombination-promoting nuclease/putative transposase [Flammeovirgaceae bacterium]|nr:Rpn family recombination-promoting nuclease/putative transposase [Flammeovirgaceae bacterium]MDW8288225.1 Rpn family recombination-promoting nuclease/putative transposase [Flammeovirgaceae bacterium]
MTDFGFKKLFGTEPNKELLIDFLNQVLPERHRIKDLTYSQNEQLGRHEWDRRAVFDLYCVSEKNERFIVELQKAKQNFFKDRSVYYASFPIQEQAQRGEWDFRLDPVYMVGILDFVFDEHKGEEELKHVVELKNQRCEVFYDKLKMIYIELPKFRKGEEELETGFEKWLYVLRHLSELQERPKRLQERVFQRLFEVASIERFTVEERRAYEDSLKYYRDLKNVIETAREEGIQEGIQLRTIEIAKRMKERGISVSEISAMTGLDEGQIQRL